MIKARDFSVTYHGASKPSLSEVNLDIEPGRLVLVTGPTGSGKSTLLMGLGGVLQHESSAHLSGEVRLAGISIREIPLRVLCRQIGWVFQNPAAQICSGTAEREVAFGLENLGTERREMGRRIDEALGLVGLEGHRFQKTHTLSGGQQQRLVIAAALALHPKVMLLDEPLSQLDPQGAEEILQVLADLKARLSIAVVMVEHRLEGPLGIADDLIVLNGGRIVEQGPTRAVVQDLDNLRAFGLEPPPLLELFERMGRVERPLSAEEAFSVCSTVGTPPCSPEIDSTVGYGSLGGHKIQGGHGGPFLLRLENVSVGYRKNAPPVIENLSLAIHKGDRIALIGANGAGKSTLLLLLAGVLSPCTGELRRKEGARLKIGLVMQNPDVMLIADSVEEELAFCPKQQGANAIQGTISSILEKLSLSCLAKRAPFSLSRGERQRTAVGSVLSGSPGLLLLDEPTTGQDRAHIDRMMSRIMEGCSAVVFSTHDMETAARHANRVIVMRSGRLVADGETDAVLSDWKTLANASVRLTEMQHFVRKQTLRSLNIVEIATVSP